MTEINKDFVNGDKSPFQEEIDLDNYFPCASRAEVVSLINQAIQDGVALMVLTGEEGSGKTMLCHVLKQQATCQIVFFPRTIDSFEEVVHNIAITLGLIREIELGDIDQSLQHIIDLLLDQSADLLVIFDEAENIFLATLERICEMLDWINGAGARLHVLLSGRKTLLENCDQVSLGNFRNTDARYFELSPLSEIETAEYLDYCAVRLPGVDAAKVFTDEVVDDIYTLAQGNFRMTNILGEEAVKPHSDDTSFMVLLEGVEEDVEIEVEKPHVMKFPSLTGKVTQYLPWIGGAVSCLLLLFILFRSGGDKNEIGKEVTPSQKTEQIEKVTATEETTGKLAEKEETVALAPVEELQPPEEQEAVAVLEQEKKSPEEKVVIVPQSGEKLAQPDIAPLPVNQVQTEVEHVAPATGTSTETTATNDNIDSDPVADIEEKELAAAVQETPPPEVVTREITDIARLRPGKLVKKNKELLSTQQPPSVKPQPAPEAVPAVVASPPHSAAERLYNARLSAGSGWESTEKKKMYTVQVMALASKTAKKNFKHLLTQVNYRQEAGNFYILEKKTVPAGVFVFYGEYPSIERARLVQNSLPQFLRDHKPYVLSINKAIAKVGR